MVTWLKKTALQRQVVGILFMSMTDSTDTDMKSVENSESLDEAAASFGTSETWLHDPMWLF